MIGSTQPAKPSAGRAAPNPRRIPINQSLAAVFMSVPAALSTGAAIAVVTPIAPIHGIFLSGLTLPLLWVGLMVWAFLARSGRRAWSGLGLLTAISCAVIALHQLAFS